MLSSSTFHLVFNSSPFGNYLLSPTPAAVILAVNDAFLRVASRTREEMVGKSVFDVFPANPADPGDSGVNALRSSILRVIETGQADALPLQRYPIRVTLPDGEQRYEERFWSATNTPIFGEDGKLLYISHHTLDVTEQTRAQAALRRSERQAQDAARQAEAERQRLDAVLEAVPLGIVVGDAEGAIVRANRTFKQYWGEDHPLPAQVEDLRLWVGRWADGSERHGRRLEPHEWTSTRLLRSEEALADVIEIESFDHPTVRRIVLNSGAPIRDSEGRITGVVVAQLDITDRIHAEEALREADRRKDEFLAMLAHELRNPLAPIAAAADILALGDLDPARIERTSAIISRQVGHLVGLVDDLLDVSRVTRGLVTLVNERLDAKRIVIDAIEQVRPLIEARRHRLSVQMPSRTACVSGDQKRLVQVLTNLLNNAAKYTPEGGEIAIDLEIDADQIRIGVADNGIGMEPDLVGRAFELFAQAKRTPDRAQGGLGIGLALVRSLVELHGGRVDAFSEGLGKGCRFTLSLPRIWCEGGEGGEGGDGGKVRPSPPARSEAAHAARRLKVMVVDDNADAADMLALSVEALGHRALIEYGSRQALVRARQDKPDVFLLDLGLPEMDGNELARRLRTQPETRAALLVAVTGYGQEHDRSSALAAGFDHHCVKPLSPATLSRLLAGFVHRQ